MAMTFDPKLLDQLLTGCERPEDILGADGLFAMRQRSRRSPNRSQRRYQCRWH
jgi:hypothetical protein